MSNLMNTNRKQYLKNFEDRNIKIKLFGNCKNYEF